MEYIITGKMLSSFGAHFKRKRVSNAACSDTPCELSILSKDTSFCRGMYNQQERDSHIQKCAKLSGGGPRLQVPLSPALLDKTEGYSFFVCFGFTTEKPFFIPGTVVEFTDKTTSKIQGTVVAEGKRPNEYAVVLCFEDPVPCEHVSAVLDHKFSVTEMDNAKDTLACIHDLVKHYGFARTYGDIPECLRGCEAALDNCLKKFDPECTAINEVILTCTHFLSISTYNADSQTMSNRLQLRHAFVNGNGVSMITSRR